MSHGTRMMLNLRCMVQRDGDLYVAHCIDLNLAAQSSSFEGAKEKLHLMIDDHLATVAALVAEGDIRSARQLIRRPSPLSVRARYQVANTLGKAKAAAKAVGKAWKERYDSPLPA